MLHRRRGVGEESGGLCRQAMGGVAALSLAVHRGRERGERHARGGCGGHGGVGDLAEVVGGYSELLVERRSGLVVSGYGAGLVAVAAVSFGGEEEGGAGVFELLYRADAGVVGGAHE
mmetsp:Transcript_20801/g.43289  ORF Transcript_20801/g.43289 Transcript_20801/m.43289 type:complete len:117 (+) Transcript_20801:669-1019(+)